MHDKARRSRSKKHRDLIIQGQPIPLSHSYPPSEASLVFECQLLLTNRIDLQPKSELVKFSDYKVV